MPDQIRHPRELLLRLPCQECHSGLHIPIQQFVRSTELHCPKCNALVEAPRLDGSLPGMQEILDAVALIDLECPDCRRTVQASLRYAGQEKQCPYCRALIALRFVAVERPEAVWKPVTSSKPAAAEPASTTDRSVESIPPSGTAGRPKAAKLAAAVGNPPSPKPVPPPDGAAPNRSGGGNGRKPRPLAGQGRNGGVDEVLQQASAAGPSPVPDPQPNGNRFVARFIGSDSRQDEPIVYESRSSDEPSRSRGVSISLPPREAGWIIWIVVLVGGCFGFGQLSHATENPLFAVAALAFLIPRLNLATRITNLILPLIIQTIRCPGCQEDIEAVGRWTVGDYTDHRDRHVLSVRHPRDGSRIGQTDCPRCGATILLR